MSVHFSRAHPSRVSARTVIVMRQYVHLRAAYADASADPRLHGIALGLNNAFSPQLDDELPDRLHALVAQLYAQSAREHRERQSD